MENIKIFESEDGEYFVKMKINLIVDIPIEECSNISKRDCINALFKMERIDLGELIFNESNNAKFITNV